MGGLGVPGGAAASSRVWALGEVGASSSLPQEGVSSKGVLTPAVADAVFRGRLVEDGRTPGGFLTPHPEGFVFLGLVSRAGEK